MTHHTTQHADGLSGGTALVLLGFSFVAGYLLGRRHMEQTWDAGEPVEISDSTESVAPREPISVETEPETEEGSDAGGTEESENVEDETSEEEE